MRPAASSPSIAQPVIAGLAAGPGCGVAPVGVLGVDQPAERRCFAAAARRCGGSEAAASSASSASGSAPAGRQVNSSRVRKREIIRTSAGPAASAIAKLPTAWATLNGIPRAESAR